jgi:hypothetical protein
VLAGRAADWLTEQVVALSIGAVADARRIHVHDESCSVVLRVGVEVAPLRHLLQAFASHDSAAVKQGTGVHKAKLSSSLLTGSPSVQGRPAGMVATSPRGNHLELLRGEDGARGVHDTDGLPVRRLLESLALCTPVPCLTAALSWLAKAWSKCRRGATSTPTRRTTLQDSS